MAIEVAEYVEVNPNYLRLILFIQASPFRTFVCARWNCVVAKMMLRVEVKGDMWLQMRLSAMELKTLFHYAHWCTVLAHPASRWNPRYIFFPVVVVLGRQYEVVFMRVSHKRAA